MSDPLSVMCPVCSARPGERCDQGPTHDERRYLAGSGQHRDRRPYDVEPVDVPEQYQHDQAPGPALVDGHLVHVLDDRTRTVGLAGVLNARAILVDRATKRAALTAPEQDARQRHFAKAAAEAAARWHEAGCPEPRQLHLDEDGDDAA